MEALLQTRNECLIFYIKEQIQSLCEQPEDVAELIAEFTVQPYDSSISTVVDGHGAWHTVYMFRNNGQYAALQFNRRNQIEKSWIDSINRVWSKKTGFYGFEVTACYYDYLKMRYVWIIHDALNEQQEYTYWDKAYGYSQVVQGPKSCTELTWYQPLMKLTQSGIADITTFKLSARFVHVLFMMDGHFFVYDPSQQRFLSKAEVPPFQDSTYGASNKDECAFNTKRVFGEHNEMFSGVNLLTVWFDREAKIWYFVDGCGRLFQKGENANMKEGDINIYEDSDFYKCLSPSFSNFQEIP